MPTNDPISYFDEMQALAESIGSDGCTMPALQVHVICCWEHDWAYVTGTTAKGVPITRAQADRRFRDCNCAHSPFGMFSPLATWRWLAVHLFGTRSYRPPTSRPLALASIDPATFHAAIADARAARQNILGTP